MSRGKNVCKILKEIRQQIADKNDIEYITSECHFQGECKGTCPKCEAEVKYLEDELNKRKQLGKAATIAGISLGIAGSFAACNSPQQSNMPIPGRDTTMEIIEQDTTEIPIVPIDTFKNKTEKNFIPPFSSITAAVCGGIEDEALPELNTFTNAIEAEIDDEEMIVGMIDPMPVYPGGEAEMRKFVKENLKYPKEAQEKGIEGRVYIQFVVEKDGSIGQVGVARGIGSGCDEEAVRVVQMMPKWKPGTHRGKAIEVRYTIPVNFLLE